MPKGRLTMAAAMTATLAATEAPALAQGSLPDQLQVCARISSKSARLECYDSVAAAARQGDVGSGSGAAPLPEPQTATPRPPAAAASSFGAEQLPRPAAASPGPAEPGEIEMAVTSARDNGLNMWQFTLSDGAVWRMTERVANFRPPAPNETVRIKRGALGSYLMRVGQQSSVRVERVR